MLRRLPIILIALALLGIAGVLWYRSRPAKVEPAPDGLAGGAWQLPDLTLASNWVNGGPLTRDSLRGHPVAIVVWSDTDPRGLELAAEAETWHQAYARYGARVIGIHAPDFAFSADSSVTRSVARRMGLHFPIAFDPGDRILHALGLGAPGMLVADGNGQIVVMGGGSAGRHRIEGEFRKLVLASGPGVTLPDSRGDTAPGPAETPLPTRFVHLGTARVQDGPLVDAAPGRPQTFTTQFRFQEDAKPLVPYPVGRWTPGAEGLTAARGGAANFVALRTEGGRVKAVIGSPAGSSARVWILDGDGWLAPAARGGDVRVDARGATYVDVNEARLHEIAIGGARLLKLSPDAPGVTFYGFAIEAE